MRDKTHPDNKTEGRQGAAVRRRLLRLTAVLALCALLLSLAGCAGSREGTGEGSPSGSAGAEAAANAGKIVNEDDESITVIDQAGREVTVPKKEMTSIAISYRVVARFLITLGEGDKITGIGKTEDFLYTLQPSLREAVDVGKGVPDLEQIASLSPDIYFHKAADPDSLEAVQDLGIPAVGLSFETPDEMKTALTVMGAVLGRRERAEELIEYYDRRVREDAAEAETIENRKTAIAMGSSVGKVADGSMLQSEMIELAGGVNPAKDLKVSGLWPTAGTEAIFKWDPDFIFITGNEGTNYTPEDLYSDPAWSEMTAVRERHIYQIPAAQDSWELPGVVSVIGIDYMKHQMYPELMDEKQLQKNIDEFYELSYGRTFTAEEIGY